MAVKKFEKTVTFVEELFYQKLCTLKTGNEADDGEEEFVTFYIYMFKTHDNQSGTTPTIEQGICSHKAIENYTGQNWSTDCPNIHICCFDKESLNNLRFCKKPYELVDLEILSERKIVELQHLEKTLDKFNDVNLKYLNLTTQGYGLYLVKNLTFIKLH